MSYLVLARKWRPQTFEQIRGQSHIVRALTNAISSGRIAHAYLFTGIRGVGKTSAARVLAKALNCAAGPTPDPCNACDSCREITEGKSPDVLEIDGASNTGVEDVRKLREAVRYPPVRGPYRVYIIDEVHMLSTAAFNALLKTLEEPPPNVVFIFATTDAHKIPVTILSRCQQFDFKRVPPRELMALLEEVARAEGISADEKSLAALAREAEGSVRDAQSLLDQVISYAGPVVKYEDVRDVLGAVDRTLVLSVARAAVKGDPRRVVECMRGAERFGYDPRSFAYDLLDVFRDLAVLKAVEKGEDLVDLAPEEVEEAHGFLADVSWESVHALFDILARGVEAMRLSPRPGLALEMVLLKMARLPPVLPLSDIVARVRGGAVREVEREAGSAPGRTQPGPAQGQRASGSDWEGRAAEVDRPQPAVPHRGPRKGAGATPDKSPGGPARDDRGAGPTDGPEMSPPRGSAFSRGDPVALWVEVLARMEKANRPFWTVLKEHSKLTAWDAAAQVAVIGYDAGNDYFLTTKFDLLTEVFREAAGPGARVELRCEDAQPRARTAPETDFARDAKREVLEHALVRDAMEIFDADVDEVRALK